MKKIILTLLPIFISSCTLLSTPETVGKFPVYGNYCGPDHPKEGSHPTPINMTDFSCMEHDACYAEKGYFSKSCDSKLIADLKRVHPQNQLEKSMQKLIISYFKRSPKLKK